MIDFDRVRQRLPHLDVVERLAGGEIGAWLVRGPDGHESVLTWSPSSQLDHTIALMDLAAAAGVPLPRYEAVVDLGDGSAAILQQRVHGHVPERVTDALVDHVIELAERRRGLLADAAQPAMALYLREDGPGFCLHEPLRSFSRDTSALLAAIEAVGERGDTAPGTDVVHLDYHLGNILVTDDEPDRVAAVIDWGGARPGSIAVDLAILAFDLTWRAPGAIQQRVESYLQATTDAATFQCMWAHASLRLLDWSIRHHPEHVDHWVAVARRHLPPA